MIRVGVLFEGKQNAWTQGLIEAARDRNESLEDGSPRVSVEEFSLSKSSELDIVLFKTMETIAKSGKVPESLQSALALKPSLALDDAQCVADVCDRHVTLLKLEGLKVHGGGQTCLQPRFRVCKDEAEFLAVERFSPYPWVCKPFVADGVAKSHDLGLVWGKGGAGELPYPVVLQEFINHGGVIFKVYVLGEGVHQIMRHSLPDVEARREGDPERGYEEFGRVSNARADGRALCDDDVSEKPSEKLLAVLVREVGARLGLRLFGMDLIRDGATGDFHLIDINYLPGYYGVEDVFGQILRMCVEEAVNRSSHL